MFQIPFPETANWVWAYWMAAREMSPDELPWPLRLFLILLGYATVAAPAIILIYYVRKNNGTGIFESSKWWARWARAFAMGQSEYQLLDATGQKREREEKTEGLPQRRQFLADLVLLAFFFSGIQTTLVLMGFLQERIITLGYPSITEQGKEDRFGDAQFLIFCNRIVALVICCFVLSLNWSRQPPHVPPLYVHSYTSFSNTMSSWCQYEALKYVSFPTQKYSCFEYGCGMLIAIGASMFLLSSGANAFPGDTATSFSGMILMVGYLLFDAFTLNWQKALFDTRPKVSKYQMMLGVNVFSAILCAGSLIEQGTLWSSIKFAVTHRNFSRDVFLLSLSGATGQLFIYSTIEKFGPIVFAVIMTIRQMLSIVLSSFYYSHPMTGWALVGFFTVFGAIFADINRKYFERRSSR
ncbi:hypothetical protein WR25_08494 [Diploscapter pachys]|uniref:Adenosine 3'-phospho 5'-phosphosulfate transporter 1 n=1 Tax=Diploscapter pachys TaxID=2018661 RepID=A0A2A2LFV9_9BILA|nr:hypothetical protein WR25_08494 [Diploscapter pachys]